MQTSSEDLITATQPEETRGIKGWRKQLTDDGGAKNKNDETMTTKAKESNKRCKQMTKRQSAKPPLNQERSKMQTASRKNEDHVLKCEKSKMTSRRHSDKDRKCGTKVARGTTDS